MKMGLYREKKQILSLQDMYASHILEITRIHPKELAMSKFRTVLSTPLNRALIALSMAVLVGNLLG